MLPGHIEINFNPEAGLVLNGQVAVLDDWSFVDDKVGDLKSDTFLPFLTGPKSVSLWAQGQRSKQYNFFLLIGAGDPLPFRNVETVPRRQKIITLPVRPRAVIGVVDRHLAHANHV